MATITTAPGSLRMAMLPMFIIVNVGVGLLGCGFEDAAQPHRVPVAVDATADAEPTVPTPDFCDPLDPRSAAPVVHVGPDVSEAPYIAALADATSTIDVEVYLMGYGAILDMLREKARAGVSVRVILDQGKKATNQKYYDLLTEAGVAVRWSDPSFRHAHAKFMIIDGIQLLVSTGNYSTRHSIDVERNFIVGNSDAADILDAQQVFDADWAGEPLDLPCTRLVVAPINASERILAVIASAQTELLIESMQFADADVRAAVAERVAAGVQVRALLADPEWIDANSAAAAYLGDLGVPVRYIDRLHAKVLIADGVRAFVGSENLSYTSLHLNRELGLILGEPTSVAVLTETFETDWSAGVSF